MYYIRAPWVVNIHPSDCAGGLGWKVRRIANLQEKTFAVLRRVLLVLVTVLLVLPRLFAQGEGDFPMRGLDSVPPAAEPVGASPLDDDDAAIVVYSPAPRSVRDSVRDSVSSVAEPVDASPLDDDEAAVVVYSPRAARDSVPPAAEPSDASPLDDDEAAVVVYSPRAARDSVPPAAEPSDASPLDDDEAAVVVYSPSPRPARDSVRDSVSAVAEPVETTAAEPETVVVVYDPEKGFVQLDSAQQGPKDADLMRDMEIDEVVVTGGQMIGSKFMAANRTGSAYYISPLELKKLDYADINRMLKAVPGVNVYEEDGYGLRPNISLRGTKAERSERITLMEDGILAAPAPYASPAAYYFPNASRMSAVEVLKGSSQVQYGPFTTGGAINMVSTPIPSRLSAKLSASYGINNTIKAMANVGNTHRHFGYLVEFLRYQSDGFKRFDDGEHAGFSRNDGIAKFMLRTAPDAHFFNSLELKFGYADENSNESYVGLTKDDFKSTPFRRYAGSRHDSMKSDHQQYVARWTMRVGESFRMLTDFYYTRFHRNWYKLDHLRLGLGKEEQRTVAQILDAPEINAAYLAVLRGEQDSRQPFRDLGRLRDNPGLVMRNNNRTYHSGGAQTRAFYSRKLPWFKLDAELGLRYHTDDEDRFQWDDLYAMENGKMRKIWEEEHGSNSNRITSADAVASHFLAKLERWGVTLTAGLRHEYIWLHRKDYTAADPRRSGGQRVENDNRTSAWIPSLGLSYRLIPQLSLFAGVHKGFSPPGVSKVLRRMDRNGNITTYTEQQKPESSLNAEAGSRLDVGFLRAELIGFYNAFSNMLGSDLLASGGQGTLQRFNVGKARVYGLESLLAVECFPRDWDVQLPVQLTYTFTQTEMLNEFQSLSWGTVYPGDEIPYINKHSVNLSVGARYRWFDFNLGARYNGDMRTEPGAGPISERTLIPQHLILDASLSGRINRYVTLRVNAINLTNRVYLVSRHPAGLRPGHPLGIFGGVTLTY